MEELNYRHLYVFWRVCQEGGFSKAATQLKIAQSAVSHQVASLEVFLGEKLLERSRASRKIVCTEAGFHVLKIAQFVFQEGRSLVHYFRISRKKREVHLGVLGGLSKNLQLKILSPLLTHKKPPRLFLEVGSFAVLMKKLENYEIDAILSDRVGFEDDLKMQLAQCEVARESWCFVSREPPPKEWSKKRKPSFVELISTLEKQGVYLPGKASAGTLFLLKKIQEQPREVPIFGFIDDVAFLRLLAIETKSVVVLPKIAVQKELMNQELFLYFEDPQWQQSYSLLFRMGGPTLGFLKMLIPNFNKN